MLIQKQKNSNYSCKYFCKSVTDMSDKRKIFITIKKLFTNTLYSEYYGQGSLPVKKVQVHQ